MDNIPEISPVSWEVFTDWSFDGSVEPLGPDWATVEDLISGFQRVAKARHRSIGKLLSTWKRKLRKFGGDPTFRDWRRFRPLRLSREEDWTDWLAFVIEASLTGAFCSHLFAGTQGDRSAYVEPKSVEREVSHHADRADLVVQWNNDTFTHVEVKVGDRNLSKAYQTSREMRARYMAAEQDWTNYILLLPDQLAAWDGLGISEDGEPGITAVTWEDVSIALRRGLRSKENALWMACAYMLVGAVEQVLLGYPGFRYNTSPFENTGVKLRLLREGLEDD